MVATPTSLSGYVQSVRRALRGRHEEYLEFVDIVDGLRQTVTAAKDDDTASEMVITQIERAVSLLDGQPELIAGLRMFLPSQYYIDIQPDAVVIKVTISKLQSAQSAINQGRMFLIAMQSPIKFTSPLHSQEAPYLSVYQQP